ncbi:MAG: DNA translocase FtsK 4TM domain-containing protein, partial [Bauldia sp.]|nr:DNA translocase FtsK 4TM domain-containing protein [Bauldia sp.]
MQATADMALDHEPSALRRFVRRNLHAIIGIGVLALVGAAATALGTWRVDDPSLSNAVNQSVANYLGYPGAVFADLAMQFLGVAAPILLIPGLIWGWRLIAGTMPRFGRLTPLSWLLGGLAAAAAAATLPVPDSWPLPTGLGGVAGDLLLRLPEALLGGIAGWSAVLVGLLLTLCAVGLLIHA